MYVYVDIYLRRNMLKLWRKQKNVFPACGANLYEFVPFGTKAATNQMLNKVTELSFAYKYTCTNIPGFRSNTIQNHFIELYIRIELDMHEPPDYSSSQKLKQASQHQLGCMEESLNKAAINGVFKNKAASEFLYLFSAQNEHFYLKQLSAKAKWLDFIHCSAIHLFYSHPHSFHLFWENEPILLENLSSQSVYNQGISLSRTVNLYSVLRGQK